MLFKSLDPLSDERLASFKLWAGCNSGLNFKSNSGSILSVDDVADEDELFAAKQKR